MATGHNNFSVAAELNSSVPCKIAAPVSPRERYLELPDLSDNPRPYFTNLVGMVANTVYTLCWFFTNHKVVGFSIFQ
jgi:hypothetical protein